MKMNSNEKEMVNNLYNSIVKWEKEKINKYFKNK